MKKLSTAKIWQFAAGQFGWAMLSGIISNWLVYFYQPDQVAISQGQTVFIPQGLVVFGIFTIIGGITAFGRIFDAFTDDRIVIRPVYLETRSKNSVFEMGIPAPGTFHGVGVLVTGE